MLTRQHSRDLALEWDRVIAPGIMHHVWSPACVSSGFVLILWGIWGNSRNTSGKISLERWPGLLLLSLSLPQAKAKAVQVCVWVVTNLHQIKPGLNHNFHRLSPQQTCEDGIDAARVGSIATQTQGFLNPAMCRTAVFDSSHSVASHFGVGEKGLHSLGNDIQFLCWLSPTTWVTSEQWALLSARDYCGF